MLDICYISGVNRNEEADNKLCVIHSIKLEHIKCVFLCPNVSVLIEIAEQHLVNNGNQLIAGTGLEENLVNRVENHRIFVLQVNPV